MKVRYPAKGKEQRKRRRGCQCSWCVDGLLKRKRLGEYSADEAIAELGPADFVGTTEWQDDHDKHCTQCGCGRDDFWEDFQDVHESIKEADGVR